ncbi:MAG: peptide-methionine (S)-S-oxide reductase MsrA [Oscillospiraceae bacterium]|nr:peptide-methionine (S)-S-oxide reductase MsrA [Bacillota bacterium]MBR6207231.1 peptide-methionine (S)-S-oxide reductase MsrA [Oscillospiraceae bacterium]
MKRAYFAGGCFWCMTPVFREAGADRVVCGYSGGEEADPVYEDVKAQRTGHRETIMLEYDPAEVSYGRLLDIYFENVDPFDAGGQFIDRGHSYTLAVYYTSEEEKALAEERIRKLEKESGQTVCVTLEPFARFYDAEEYHQDYDLKNPEAFERELIESGRKRAGG